MLGIKPVKSDVYLKASKKQLDNKLGLRSSGAAGTHLDRRTKRQRSRGDKKRAELLFEQQ